MISNRLRLDWFRQILRIRMIEEAIAANYGGPGKVQEMRCPVHLSIGQEAAAVGVCAALHPDDVVVSTHRCHAHYLAKGGSLPQMMAELFGKVDGCLGGRGGSMHLADEDAGLLLSIPIVGASVPLAVGAALSFAFDGDNRIAVAFVGDGAMEEGSWHESANFASLHKLPILFVCENNLYSIYSPLHRRQVNADIARLARAHGLETAEADGNDVDAVHAAAAALVERVRTRQGPAFLVLPTYRHLEHCGPNCDDHLGYRPGGELAQWRKSDPLIQARAALTADGLLTEDVESRMTGEIAGEIEDAFDFARHSPLPQPETAALHVYAG